MKKVLILSYYFPPMGMGGTQRLLYFVKMLPKYGWQPHVITVKDIAYHAHDPQLLQSISGVNITRCGSLDPARILAKLRGAGHNSGGNISENASGFKKIIYSILSFFLIPDTKILWRPFAMFAIKRLLRKEKFDLVFSSGPPHSSHLLARKVAKAYKIPWVADFRDGWSGGDFQHNKTTIHHLFDRLLQAKVAMAADYLIAVSDGLKKVLEWEGGAPVTLITNGFDAACFSAGYSQTKKFELVHTGSVGNFVEPDILLATLKKFAQNFGEKSYRMRFIGADLTGKLAEKISRLGLSATVECTGYLPHEQVTQLLQKSDLLIYIITGAASKGFIPGKTFEYMAARRPILAIAEPVEGVQLLSKSGAARCVNPVDGDMIYSTLCEMYQDYLRNPEFQANAPFISQFEWGKLSAKLAAIFEKVTD